MPELVYFDSCVFIELLQQSNQKRFDACEALRAKAAKGDLMIVTSAITIAEVNKLPDHGSLPEEQSRLILAFFENEFIAVRPADRRTTEYAHELTRTDGIMPIDAVHVATAVISRCSVCYTYDSKKKRRKGLLVHNLNVGSPPLKIELPPDPLSGTLFDEKHIAKLAETSGTATGRRLTRPFGGEVAADAPASDSP